MKEERVVVVVFFSSPPLACNTILLWKEEVYQKELPTTFWPDG